jgi:isoquinoline 1-oxidoreductase beta subunit
VLELAAARAGWGTPTPAGVGRGLALHHSFESTVAAVAEVRIVAGVVRVERLVMAVDCGRVVNPDIVRSQLESAAVYGLSAALHGEVTFEKGRPQQSNFHDYQPLRLDECPAIETHLVSSVEAPTGIGEPGLPVIAPAVANAVFALTGKRLRDLPFRLQDA